jgi:Domain of unknown function (DUF4278)
MPVFVISLAIALIAFYLCQKSADEMAYLCAVISVVSLIVSLVLAPWQLKLLLLVLALISQRWWFSRNSRMTLQPNQPIKLSVSEVNYQPTTPTTQVVKHEMTRQYRGQVCKPSNLEQPNASELTYELKYRGVGIHNQHST